MKKTLFFALLSFAILGCNKEEVNTSLLEGQWVLNKVSCFCYYEEGQKFDQHYIWFYPEQGLMVANGSNGSGDFNFKEPGRVYKTLTDNGELGFVGDPKRYTVDFSSDKLVLTYVDDPMIADDEISYTFIKGNADQSCLDPSKVNIDYCTKEYNPICGCDGITYGNACEAENAGVQSFVEGSCN